MGYGKVRELWGRDGDIGYSAESLISNLSGFNSYLPLIYGSNLHVYTVTDVT
jgi:hypothetical protein